MYTQHITSLPTLHNFPYSPSYRIFTKIQYGSRRTFRLNTETDNIPSWSFIHSKQKIRNIIKNITFTVLPISFFFSNAVLTIFRSCDQTLFPTRSLPSKHLFVPISVSI